MTLHHLCIDCIHTCRQDESVRIVSCPRREVKPTDTEFKDLIDELKNMEHETDVLRTRARDLIEKALREDAEGGGSNGETTAVGDDDDLDLDDGDGDGDEDDER